MFGRNHLLNYLVLILLLLLGDFCLLFRSYYSLFRFSNFSWFSLDGDISVGIYTFLIGYTIWGVASQLAQWGRTQDARDKGLIPGLERYLGVGNGKWLQYSCLENSMDRGASQAVVHGVTKSWTLLSNWAHTYNFLLYNCSQFSRMSLCICVILGGSISSFIFIL